MKKRLAIGFFLGFLVIGVSHAETAREALWPVLVRYSETMGAKDLKGHMACYAERVDWFGKSMTRKELEAELAKQFKQYDTMSLSLMEEFDFSMKGDSAAVACRKMWYFCEKEKGTGFCGMTQAKYGLVREGGEWKINSVRDMAVVWVEKKSSDCCME